jgi:WD40 repeat protein
VSEPRFDVFLSHTSLDKPTIERIAVKLDQVGIRSWFDSWRLTPGGRWQEEIVEGIHASRTFAVFVGPHGIGDWVREELALAKDRAAKERDFRLFPVLLPGLPDPFDPTSLPPFLSTHTWVDLRAGYENERIFQRLINAIHGVPQGSPAEIRPTPGHCPYRGLKTFDEADAEFFFGREADVQRLIEQVKTDRFLAVIGPSGSGKSSLVRAGFIPALRQGRLAGSESWRISVFRPGAHPVAALAAQLIRLFPQHGMQATVDGLIADARSLHLAAELALADAPTPARVLLVVDQFEEVFTLCQDDRERFAFLENLLYAASIPGGRCTVLVAMRADFYARSSVVPALAASIAAHQHLVTPLTGEDLRAAIVQPAWSVGLEFEAGLVETIIADVAQQPGSLPLLQHALLELWTQRRGSVLTLEGYQNTGGVAGSLAQRADEVYLGLPPESQQAARRVLLRLTQPGEATEDTRRRATLAELDEGAGALTAIDALVAARLLTTSQDDETGEPAVDVAHEALIRAWPRLRAWLDEDRAGLRAHRRLTEAAAEWERSARDPDVLYRGARLAEAEGLATRQPERLNSQERAFIAESAAQRDREIAAAQERRRSRERLRRRVMIGLALFSGVALMLASVAAWQWWEAGNQQAAAQRAQRHAESQQQIALSRQLAAQAINPRTGGFDRRLLLAVEAERLHPDSVDARNSLLTLLGSSPELIRFMYDPQHREMFDIRYSEDGQSVVTGTDQGSILIWDVEQQQIVTTIAPDDGWRYGMFDLSPDGRSIATLRIDPQGIGQSIRLLDMTTLQVIRDIPIPNPTHGVVTARLAFSPDGQLLVVARASRPGSVRPSDSGHILVWNVASGEQVIDPIRAHGRGVWAVDFNPDGTVLLTGGVDGSIRFWDTTTWEPVGKALWADGWLDVAQFSPDGRYVAAAGLHGSVDVWDLDGITEVRKRSFDEPTEVFSLAFSSDSTLLVTTSESGLVNLLDLTGEHLERRPLAEHAGFVAAVAFSPVGHQFVSVGFGGVIAIWDATTPSRLATTTNVPDMFGLNHNGTFSVNADGGEFYIGSTSSGEVISTLKTNAWSGWPALSQSGERVALIQGYGPVSIFNTTTGEMIGALSIDLSTQISTAAFSQDDALIATGTQDGQISLWDGHTLERIGDLPNPHDSSVSYLLFDAEGTTLLSAGMDGQVQVWDTRERARNGFVRAGQPLTTVTFDPTKRLIAASGGGGAVYIWNLHDLTPAGPPLVTAGGWLTNVQFSPDGQLIAAGDATGHITIWEARTHTPIGDSLSVEEMAVRWIAFTHDSASLVSLARNVGDRQPDGELTVWTISTDAWVSLACTVANRNLSRAEWTQYLGSEPYHVTCPGLPIPDDSDLSTVDDSGVTTPVIETQ